MTRFEDKVRRAIATLDKTVCGIVMKLVEVSGWFEVQISIEDVQGRKASINYNLGASSEAWATEKMNASRTKEFRIAVTNVSNEIVGQLVRQRAAEKATTTTQETTSMDKETVDAVIKGNISILTDSYKAAAKAEGIDPDKVRVTGAVHKAPEDENEEFGITIHMVYDIATVDTHVHTFKGVHDMHKWVKRKNSGQRKAEDAAKLCVRHDRRLKALSEGIEKQETSMEKPMTAMEKLKADINKLKESKPEPQPTVEQTEPTVIPVPRGMMDVDSVVAGMIKLYDGREPDSIMYSPDNHSIVITMDDYTFDILDSTSEQALRDKLANMTPLNIVGMIMTEFRNHVKTEQKPEPVVVEIVTAEPVAEKLQPTEAFIKAATDHLKEMGHDGTVSDEARKEVEEKGIETVLKERIEELEAAEKQPESTQEATEEPTQPSGEGEDKQEPEESMGVSQKVWGPILATANAKMHMALAKKGGYFDKWEYNSVYLEQDMNGNQKRVIVIMGANAGQPSEVLATIKEFETDKEMWDWLGNGRKSSRVINKIAASIANYGEEEEGCDSEPEQTEDSGTDVRVKRGRPDAVTYFTTLLKDLNDKFSIDEWSKKLDDPSLSKEESDELRSQLNKDFNMWKYKWFNTDWDLMDWDSFVKGLGIDDKSRLFEIIGASDDDDVKRAFRRWMTQNHPDRNPNADLSLVQEVNALMDKYKQAK